jgi:rod shape determining protein RodA
VAKKAPNFWKDIDWVIVTLYIILVFFGWMNIYAAVYNDAHSHIFDFTQRYGMQMVWIAAAFVLAIMAISIDSRFFTVFAWPLFILGMLMLAAVPFLGKEVNGARSWFEIGPLHLQPSEFVKFGACLALSKYFSGINIKINSTKSLFTIGGIILGPIILIMLQPDMGSALVYLSFTFVLFREGMPGVILFFGFLVAVLFVLTLLYPMTLVLPIVIGIALIALFVLNRRYKYPLIGLASIGIPLLICWGVKAIFKLKIEFYYFIAISGVIAALTFAIISFFRKLPNVGIVSLLLIAGIFFTFSVDYVFDNLLAAHQKQRINILLGKESDPLGAEYNVNQSKIAIGSGGLLGKGFLQGTQTKYNFVPEQSTDFIFCTVGEEWGFAGSLGVLGLFALLLMRLIYLAERQRSVFSRVYGYGVASILFFHVAINVGMTIGLIPVIGIPLPFFSYGGSSLWSFTVLLFVFLKLDANRLDKMQ